MSTQAERANQLVREHGTTYAEEAGITLRDTPSPLYRLLVLSHLLSARISADIAVAAARELSKAGFRTPRRMADATWQQRVDALGRGHYRRYDERTSTQLGDGAERLAAEYDGDLRRLRDSSGSTKDIEKGLQEFPGIGPTGAAIFCREAQGVWPELAPYVDTKALDGAKKVRLPTSAHGLAELADDADGLARLCAACVRVSLDDDLATSVD